MRYGRSRLLHSEEQAESEEGWKETENRRGAEKEQVR